MSVIEIELYHNSHRLIQTSQNSCYVHKLGQLLRLIVEDDTHYVVQKALWVVVGKLKFVMNIVSFKRQAPRALT